MNPPASDDEPRPPPLPAAEFSPDCPNHPGVKVRYRCTECGFGGCGACATRRDNRVTGAASFWCLRCGNRTIEVAAAPLRGPPLSRDLPRCLTHPVRLPVFPHFALYALVAFGADLLATPLFTFVPRMMQPVSGADFETIMQFVGIAIFGPFVWAFCLHLMLGFVEAAAGGEGAARVFGAIDLVDVAARKRMVAAGVLFAAAGLPMALILAGRGDPALRPLALLYGAVQCLIPMGLAMIAAAHQPGASRSLPHLLKSIARVKGDYLILLLCSLPLFIPDVLVAVIRPDWLTAYWLLASPARAYVRVVQLNLMGRIVRERADALTWAA